ncbi:MAG: hypothetical protein WBN88_14765 [Anderseniella sp.]
MKTSVVTMASSTNSLGDEFHLLVVQFDASEDHLFVNMAVECCDLGSGSPADIACPGTHDRWPHNLVCQHIKACETTIHGRLDWKWIADNFVFA